MREGLGLPGAPQGSGGVFTQMAVLARELANNPAYRVVLLTEEQFEYPGMTVRVLPKYPTKSRWMARAQRRYRAELAALMASDTERAVVMFPHEVRPLHMGIASAAGCKTVLWINGDHIVEPNSITKSIAMNDQIRACIPIADAVGVLNHYEQRLVSEGWGRDSVILTSGIEAPDPALATRPQDGALWVGRTVPGKRPWMFLELAKRNPEHRFRMVMRTRGASKTTLDDYVEFEAARCPNVEILRDVPTGEMNEIYATSRVLVVTSASEGFGRVMVEAGAVGTQVYSLEINVDGMLSDPVWGMCADGDYDVLTARLGELLDSPAPSTEERLNIRDNVLGRYGAARMANEVDALINTMYGER